MGAVSGSDNLLDPREGKHCCHVLGCGASAEPLRDGQVVRRPAHFCFFYRPRSLSFTAQRQIDLAPLVSDAADHGAAGGAPLHRI